MPKKATYVFLTLLGIIAVLFFYNKYKVAPKINFNAINLIDSEGNSFLFNRLKGKNMVVCFYAGWCGDCLKELKLINKIKNENLQGVEIICITDEPLAKMQLFKEKTGYPFVFLKMKEGFNETGVHSIPLTYIVNKNLQVVKEQVGYIHWDDPSTIKHIKSLF